MRLGHADQGNDPAGTTTRKGYDLIAQGFGVGLQLDADARRQRPAASKRPPSKVAAAVRDGAERRPDQRVRHAAAAHRPDSAWSPSSRSPRRRTRRPPSWSATCATTCCRAIYAGHAATTSTSSARPRSTSTSPRCCRARCRCSSSRSSGSSFLLLMIAFRSLLVPLTAAVMNLFAAAASFGVVVAIFQWGWGSEAARHRHGRPDRGLRAGAVLRHPVRPVDGLPGLPGQPDARGVGAHQRQRAGHHASARPRPAASSPPRRSS